MAQTILNVWNIALASVGERSLASTAEAVEAQRILNEVWQRGKGAPTYLLEQGLWTFATTRSAPTAATSTAAFGFAWSFSLPTDFVRVVDVSTDADMKDPLLRYEIEGARLYSPSSVVYMTYVSSSTDYGGALRNWPDSFALWGGHWMGTQIAPRIKNDIDAEALIKRANELLISARLKDGVRSKVPWPPRSMTDLEHRNLDFALELIGLKMQQGKGG